VTWEQWRRDNLAGWENRVDIHTGPHGYDVAGLLGDAARISNTVRLDRPLLGEIVGLDVVHLQCHLGTDTLSLARLGARSVTGLDFSPKAIAHSRELFERAGQQGRFVVADVHDSAAALGATYDLVYASVGAINWIPSMARWMQVAASLLRPGGRLYLRDVHPMIMVIDPESDGDLKLRYPYGETAEPVTLQADTTYTGDGTRLVEKTTHEWSHGVGEIVQGALDAGLTITSLHEHFYADWQAFRSMVEVEPGKYVLPEGPERLPLLFTLTAAKPRA
jgi:SAM-dependent methyltransferase